ncbi:putative membrane protein YphA (DoxX/SURF4 family) [Saccharomonospora amisosensis]|uniref:Putative membrane protein YphA (DoxX/SURF4 family) n=1 Tax=Saccharomonospora amisosensis TaxID=1128677 RepID=A0A7X5ZTI5_9PSEU|nr:DoxX family protein [Saccharomonospora amisosensis]NIJ15038.1 putative membrane protein YphA (DoxX/SURF4 family) [Saccharomonospora amisosensis]
MILRRVARPLLASIFISGGINALRMKEQHAEVAKPLVDRTVREKAEQLPSSVPTDPETLVQVDAAAKILGGSLLALGIFPRVSAMILLGSLVPTTVAAHPFWEEKDEQAKQQQLTQFIKNAGLAGGLLLAVADTGGKPSLGWRAKHAAAEVNQQVQDKATTVQRGAGKVGKKAGKATGMAKRTKAGKGPKAAKAAAKVAKRNAKRKAPGAVRGVLR